MGPRGMTPEETEGEPEDEDGRLEEDLEAIIEEMNGGGPELGTGGTNEEGGPHGACPVTPCNRGQGPAAEDSDSSD
eukprot:873853-Alexandrium_andersonii.AAC.1